MKKRSTSRNIGLESIAGLSCLKGTAAFSKKIQKPAHIPRCDQSVMYWKSPFMAPPEDAQLSKYQPVDGGGYFIRNGKQLLTRPIVQGMNHLITGDRPLFALKTGTGSATAGFDSEHSAFPLFGRDSTGSWNQVWPTLCYIAIGVKRGADVHWLHEMDEIHTTFLPGYVKYRLPAIGHVTVAPLMDAHGVVIQVKLSRPSLLVLKVSGMTWANDRSWSGGECDHNRVEFQDGIGRLTEFNMGTAEVWFGMDGAVTSHQEQGRRGEEGFLTSIKPVRQAHMVAAWGVREYDQQMAGKMMSRLDNRNTSGWKSEMKKLQAAWFDAIIGRALEPRKKFDAARRNPAAELQRTIDWWDARREQFVVETPDKYFNAAMRWVYTTTQYNQLGPGLTNSGSESDSYGHLSPGWWGKTWCGDHDSHGRCLRLYGASQLDDTTYKIADPDSPNRHYPYFETVDGAIPWMTQALEPAIRENHNPFWVDQVWWHYQWTADKQFLKDLWPIVQRACDWQCKVCDPDEDGLFREHYGFWTGDNGGEGPKAVTVTVTSWAMLDRAAKMAAILGDAKAEKKYRMLADRSYQAIQREMWNDEIGVLGSIGGEGTWREHMQAWNECLAVEVGALTPEQGRRAMRWIESHYGFNPNPGVHLLMGSDWFPLRWSLQFVHTGDTCRSAMAGLKSGDADLWWSYIATVARAAFNGRYPGINYGINNQGASEGIEEQLDSTDAHIHMAVRGLFGITPDIPNGTIRIEPNFPSAWKKAFLKTADITVRYERKGDTATFVIESPRSLIKVVRGNATGETVTTPREKKSVVSVKLGSPVPYARPPHKPTIRIRGIDSGNLLMGRTFEVVNKDADLRLEEQGLVPPSPLTDDQRRRQVMIDLKDCFNVSYHDFGQTPVLFDYDDRPIPLSHFWGLPVMLPFEGKSCGANQAKGLWRNHRYTRDAATGVRFLVGDVHCTDYPEEPRLIALSITDPRPYPSAAVIAIGLRCEQVWPLMQSYAHAMKNYIPNGEIILRYEDGTEHLEQLIPPYNMDTYFQHYSLKTVPVPLGQLHEIKPWGWGFDCRDLLGAHADALCLPADPARVLKEIEFRAVCTESIICVAGLTVIPAKNNR